MENKKIVRIYICVITIITAIAVIFGIYRIIKMGTMKLPAEKSESSKLESFESIKLDTNKCDIELKVGDGYEIEYDISGLSSKDYYPQFEVSDGILYITQKNSGGSSLFKSFSSCDVVVTIPSDAGLKSVEMKTDVGDLDIKDILCKEVIIDSDVGDILISNVEGDIIDTAADVGDIEISNCKCDTVSVSSNVGDVTIKDTICNAVSTDSNVGDVTLENVVDSSGNKPQMDIDLDIGETKINK